jgi:hypothetical protein
MTELKLNSKPETTGRASRPDRRLYITAVFAGLLMVTLFLGITGGSKGKGKPTSVDPPNQNSSTQSGLSGSVNSDASTTSTLATSGEQSKPVKKPIRKRPSTIMYVDGTYGVSFRYPRKYVLKPAGPSTQESATHDLSTTNFVEAGGVPVVSVELPKTLYQGTDFVSAFFNVSVNKSLTSEQCGQFAALSSPSAGVARENSGATAETSGDTAAVNVVPTPASGTLLPSRVSIRGVEFAQLETSTDQSNTKYYHRFENGACYEFALGLNTAEHEPGDKVIPVDDHDVFARLEKILATVRIRPVLAPQISADASAGSGGESNQH